MIITDIFKMLSDETRVRILNILIDDNLCVCEIEAVLDITQSNASRHLNKLKTTGIIDSAKDSQWTYYTIHESFKNEHTKLYEYMKEQFSSDPQCQDDSNKLSKYRNSSFTRSDVREKREDVVTALKISCGCSNSNE